MNIRRGETLLLTIGIPVLLLVFFSLAHVTTSPERSSCELHRTRNPRSVHTFHFARRTLDRDGF